MKIYEFLKNFLLINYLKFNFIAVFELVELVKLKSQCQNITSWLKTIMSVQMYT